MAIDLYTGQEEPALPAQTRDNLGLTKIGGTSFKEITRGKNKGLLRITGGPHRGKLAEFNRWTDQFHNILVVIK